MGPKICTGAPCENPKHARRDAHVSGLLELGTTVIELHGNDGATIGVQQEYMDSWYLEACMHCLHMPENES